MKNSGIPWIGEIPEGWKVERLKSQVVEINEKNSPLKTDYVLSLTIKDGVIPYEEKGDVGNKAKENHEEYKLAYPDTIVLNSMNILIGAVGICKYYGCVSPVYYVFKAADSSDLRYLNYIMSSTPYQKYLRKYANGILEIRLRVSSDDILKRHIPLPPLSEQQAIADFLDKKCAEIDQMVALQEKFIEELKAYKQSLITETVTKGLNPNAPMKDSGVEWIGEIPEGWKIMKLAFLTSKIGSGSTPTGGANVYLHDGIKFLRSQNIYFEGLELSDVAYISEEIDAEMKGTRVQSGDVLLNITGGSIGRCYFVDDTLGRANVNQHVSIIRPKNIRTKYLKYQIQSFLGQHQIAMLQTGGNREGLSATSLSNFKILYPDFPEQQAIADYLDKKCAEIDQLIAVKQKKADELKEYKKSIIYEYVTGKRSVCE